MDSNPNIPEGQPGSTPVVVPSNNPTRTMAIRDDVTPFAAAIAAFRPGEPAAQPAGAPPAGFVPNPPAPVEAPAVPGSAEPPAFDASALFRPPVEPANPNPNPDPNPAPNPDDAEFVPDPANPKAGHAFAKLRKQNAETLRRAEQAEKEAQERAAREKVLADALKAKEEQLAQVTETLGRTNLEASPAFQERYSKGFNEIRDDIKTTLTSFGGVAPEEAEVLSTTLLGATAEETARLLEPLTPAVGGAVIALAAKAQQLATRRAMELQNWREGLANDENTRARREILADVQDRRALAEDAVRRAYEEGGVALFAADDPVLGPLGVPVVEAFKAFIGSASAEDLTTAAAQGFALPVYAEQLQRALQERDQYRQALETYGKMGTLPVFPNRDAAVAPAAPANPFAAPTKETAQDVARNLVHGMFSGLRPR